jgi:hypothetical protein
VGQQPARVPVDEIADKDHLKLRMAKEAVALLIAESVQKPPQSIRMTVYIPADVVTVHPHKLRPCINLAVCLMLLSHMFGRFANRASVARGS